MKVLTRKELANKFKNKEISLEDFRKELKQEVKIPDIEQRQVEAIDGIRKGIIESVENIRKALYEFTTMLRESNNQSIVMDARNQKAIVESLKQVASAIITSNEKDSHETRPLGKWRFIAKRDEKNRIEYIDAIEIK